MADPVINKRTRASFGQLMLDLVVDRSITGKLYKNTNYFQLPESESVEQDIMGTDVRIVKAEIEQTPTADVSTEKPKEPKSLPHNSPAVPLRRESAFSTIFKGVLVETFLRQGYNFSKNEVTTTEGETLGADEAGVVHVQGKVAPYNSDLNVSHMIWTILGFPTRFDKLEDGTTADPDTVAPRMSGKQIFYNMIGGWYSRGTKTITNPDQSTKSVKVWDNDERIFWQWVAVFTGIKALIFVFNVAATLFRFVWNILKWGTEVVPGLLKNLTGYAINDLTTSIREDWSETDRRKLSMGKKIALITFNVILTTLLVIPHTIFRIAHLVGQAITSPEQLIRRSFEWGYSLKITNHKKTTAVFRWVMAIAASLLSMALVASVWAVALPFAIAGFVSLVPQSLAVVNAIANSWLIAPLMSYVYVGIGYLSALAPAVSFVAGFLGLAVTQTYLAFGVILGTLFNALVLPIALRLSDEFSDWWALRPKNSGPYHFLKSLGKGNHHHDHHHRGIEMNAPNKQNKDLLKQETLEIKRLNDEGLYGDALDYAKRSVHRDVFVGEYGQLNPEYQPKIGTMGVPQDELPDGENYPVPSAGANQLVNNQFDVNEFAHYAAHAAHQMSLAAKEAERASHHDLLGAPEAERAARQKSLAAEKEANVLEREAFNYVHKTNPNQLSLYFNPAEDDPHRFQGFSKETEALIQQYQADHPEDFRVLKK